MRKKNKYPALPAVEISGYAAEGKSLARHEGKVIFVPGAVPGDVVDLQIVKSKKDWAEAVVTSLLTPSPIRVKPFCKHFGVCGGCKWQMLPYEKQLEFKQQEAIENLRRIGKVTDAEILPIRGSELTRHYRNKLEFTFSNKKYLTREELNTGASNEENALGYHAPRVFDKVINIEECWLMDDINNRIRNTVRDYAEAHQLEYYDIKAHTGWLRNLIIRHCTTGQTMVNLCVHYEDEPRRKALLDHLLKEVPNITTLLYTINPKWNDSLQNLEPQVYSGPGYVTEKLGDFEFIISPKSFFQTNTRQAETLYSITREFAELTGTETVYDLYCGTGSIGIFLSKKAKKVIGVEVVEEAIADAKRNAEKNDVQHAQFFVGDVIKVCDDAFFAEHGKPDVVITDPPRAGMHEKLVQKLLEMEAPRIVYVSCNVATQARDLALLQEKYRVVKVQPVDMFPHTHHIECVVLLQLH